MGVVPDYYASEFTLEVCKNLNYELSPQIVEADKEYKVGSFVFVPIFIQHSIPGAFFYKILEILGIIIETITTSSIGKSYDRICITPPLPWYRNWFKKKI